jgi:hypothetical protein
MSFSRRGGAHYLITIVALIKQLWRHRIILVEDVCPIIVTSIHHDLVPNLHDQEGCVLARLLISDPSIGVLCILTHKVLARVLEAFLGQRCPSGVYQAFIIKL